MGELHNFTLLYDGDCPMCQGVVRMLARIGLSSRVAVMPSQEAELTDESAFERIRVEILLQERNTGEIIGGIQAVRQLAALHPGYGWLAMLLSIPPVAAVAGVLYQTIAYNRRILSPPAPRNIPCACDPPDNPRIRRQFYGLLVAVVLLSVGLSAVLAKPQNLGFGSTVVRLIGVWVPCTVALLIGNRARLLVFAQQALVITTLGGLALIPVTLVLRLSALWLREPTSSWVPLGVLGAMIVMDFSFRKRSAAVKLPGWLYPVWLLGVGVVALSLLGN